MGVRAHPYRELRRSAGRRSEPSGDPDVAIIYALAILLGGFRLIVALAIGETFGAEASIAAILAIAGAIGWWRDR